MPNEQKSAVESFLEGAEESTSQFEQPVDPFEVPLEKTIVEDKEEKPVPYHKDEKLQKYIDKVVENRLKDLSPAAKVENREEDDDYYVRLIGNDTPEKVAMVREAKARDERMLKQAEDRVFSRLSESKQEEAREQEEADKELENAYEGIKETFDVDLTSNPKLRSEFLTFVEKIAPKDEDGDIINFPDMSSAWETFSEINKGQPSRAKQLASRGMSRSSEASNVQIKKVNWNAVEEYLDSLK